MTEPFNPKKHTRTAFDCGKHKSLTNYLKLQATKESKIGLAKTHVHTDNEHNVLGYFTLSSSELPRESVPEELLKKLPESYSGYPAILIGRLAITQSQQGFGLGGELMVEAIEMCINHAETIGTRAILVDPIDEDAASFYEKFMFKRLPDSNRMVLHIDHGLRAHFGLS
ncbi:MAG: GNAT family N-acetyltransferase [Flavobacteriales bacterium]|jgi:predicted GNAT family N-acyltransferase|nr:GNAT family N-acetyltransferase [Flavobacteriales bacterium]